MARAQLSVDAGRRRLLELYEQEADRIHGYLRARVSTAAVAEDLTAEVFSDAARRCAEGRSAEVTGAWLQTVAHRRLVDHWRRNDTRRRLAERLRLERPIPDPDGDHGSDDGDGRVLAALSSLPDRQRAALCLRYMDEFSVSEVAVALDVGYQGAESLLARARRSFASAYEEVS